MKRRLELDPRTVPLPKGTRVVLAAAVIGRDGARCEPGTAARVSAVDHPRYEVVTPHGRTLDVQRHQLDVPHEREAEVAGERAWAWEALADEVVLEVVVGSRAWGLADADSDEDLRGAFLLPFAHHAGLWAPPDELAPAGADAVYWEVEKLIRHALRADPNAVEILWSPLVRRSTPVGDLLRARREAFASRRVHGALGRYALGQLDALGRRRDQHAAEQRMLTLLHADPDLPEPELVRRLVAEGLGDAAVARELVRRVAHALHDRGLTPSRSYDDLRRHLAQAPPDPAPWRPKNAYNLLRLLHSGIRWATRGEPLIRVDDPALRARLLAVKRGEVDLDEVIAEAHDLARRLDAAMATSKLPEAPDVDAADALLRACRAWAARRHFGLPTRAPVEGVAPPRPPAAPGVPLERARALVAEAAAGRDVVLCAVTGAHLYGFPSPGSDLDLKGVHLAPARDLLGLDPPPRGVDRREARDGLELDLTLDEAARAVGLLVRGHGDVLERLASPWQVLPVPGASAAADRRLGELRALARAGLHRGVHAHYRGFLRQLRAAAPTVKGWLHAYRVALTGAHLLRAGEVVADLPTLLRLVPDRDLAHVHALVAARRAGADEDGLIEGLRARVEDDLAWLEHLLDAARDASPLPEACPNRADLDAWLRWWRTNPT